MMEKSDSVQVFSDKYLENISDSFKILYNEEQLSDVTIYCKEGSIKAHKLILAASSPYFCKIFRENKNEFPILILQGTSLNQMKNLIDLLYTGITDVQNNDLEALYNLVKDFEIKGVNFGSKSSSNNLRLEMNHTNISPESSHNRDTRFKGQKRVAVDYVHYENSQTQLPSTSTAENEICLPKRPNLENNHMEESLYVKREITSPVPTESTILSTSDITSISDGSLHIVHTESKLTAWAKKQRKFKCDLCPSSFKRSSHLSRHQLVHTGERPYSCDKCDKAFSRHDKLKHHIRKTHEYVPDSMYERIENDHIDSDIESNNLDYSSPNHNRSENGLKTEHSGHSTPKSSPPLFTISHITSILEDSFVNPPKKGRGRPRKYPPPTASPAVLNSNQELPVSNNIKATKDRKKRTWVDNFVEENEDNTTSRRLRERKNVNNNEDVMSSRITEEERIGKGKGLFCQICDKPFIYRGRLKSHMEKLHGVIDKSQEESSLDNIQKYNIGNTTTLPDDGVRKESSIIISDVCSLSDTNKEFCEGNSMEKLPSLETRSEKGSKSAENLTYEQLRELLPKGCTLRPIADFNATVSTKSNIGKKECSEAANRKISDKGDPKNLPHTPHTFVISSLLQGATITPKEKKKDTSSDIKEKQEPKDFKIRRRKKRKGAFIRCTRPKKTKTRSVQPTKNYEQTEALTKSIVGHSLVSDIENSTLSNMAKPTSSFQIPKFSSAIEISIVSPNERYSSTTIPDKNKVDEDLSISVLDSPAKKNQQDETADCKLSNKVDIRTKHKKLLTERYNAHSESGSESKTGNVLPPCDPQVSQNSVMAQDSQLPISQNNLSIPQKRKRGRPRKEKKIIVTPQVKRGRGRPRTNVYPVRPGVQNYNLTNLPYGDLNYLTSQASTTEEEEAVLMEPLVEINMDQTEQCIDAETNQNVRITDEKNKELSRITNPIIIEPVVQIAEQNVKNECSTEGVGHESIDISEIETKIGLIGECTISVAN